MTTKYDSIAIGDKIAFPKSLAQISGGIVSKVKGLNGDTKVVETSNGGRFHVSRWDSEAYYLEKAGI